MLAKVISCAIVGLEGAIVEVEANPHGETEMSLI